MKKTKILQRQNSSKAQWENRGNRGKTDSVKTYDHSPSCIDTETSITWKPRENR